MALRRDSGSSVQRSAMLVTFGRDPNTLTNATGLLPNDRTHVFRVMGSVAIPKTGFCLPPTCSPSPACHGPPRRRSSLPQGLTRILLETPGTRRLSSQTLLDLRVSHVFDLPRKGRVELLLDVLNAFNQTSEERLADDNYFSQNFARPSVFVDPRRAMLGARLTF